MIWRLALKQFTCSLLHIVEKDFKQTNILEPHEELLPGKTTLEIDIFQKEK